MRAPGQVGELGGVRLRPDLPAPDGVAPRPFQLVLRGARPGAGELGAGRTGPRPPGRATWRCSRRTRRVPPGAWDRRDRVGQGPAAAELLEKPVAQPAHGAGQHFQGRPVGVVRSGPGNASARAVCALSRRTSSMPPAGHPARRQPPGRGQTAGRRGQPVATASRRDPGSTSPTTKTQGASQRPRASPARPSGRGAASARAGRRRPGRTA
jgi:hypothetical protein